MQNDDINNRIALVIKELGYNKNSFSKAIGLSNNTTIGNIVSGRKTKPSFDVIYRILTTFDSINKGWLLTGEGSMLQSDVQEAAPAKAAVKSPANQEVVCKECRLKEEIIKEKEARIQELIHSKEESIKDKERYIALLESQISLLKNELAKFRSNAPHSNGP